MLYREKTELFSEALFQNPPSAYRDVPFWAWNTKVTPEDVDFCLDIFQKMGMGGFFIHSRTGMNIPYLGEDFLKMVSYARDQAESRGLKTWLYDEDRWPSGFAGGKVTENKEYRARYLVWSPRKYQSGEVPKGASPSSTAVPVRSGERKLLGVYQVREEDGWMKSYRRLELGGFGEKESGVGQVEGEWPEGREGAIWYAYLEVSGDSPWFNGQSYVDTLNPQAVKAFLDITYQLYWKQLGKYFGKDIPGIFTDEPQFVPKQRAESIRRKKDVLLPFTDNLPQRFQEEWGEDLLDYLPELFYDQKNSLSRIRYQYHRLVSRMFAESYGGQLGKWCGEHGILLTGHLMKEPLLSFQTQYVGETMASYQYFQIPGVDMLCGRRELTTVKQAQSVTRQSGCEGVMSELYGGSGWEFDFCGHKFQGDWQAALGVTLRVPHLAWTSMEGEAKRDYPASIFYQSPWYLEYRRLEDYFARIGLAMSRGKPQVKIGVIHPVESCWLEWGTLEKTQRSLRELDQQFLELTEFLLKKNFDFDFIAESLLPEQFQGIEEEIQGGIAEEIQGTAEGENRKRRMKIGQMAYEAVIVPFMKTIRRETLEILKKWREAGGLLIFCEGIPEYVDARPSNDARYLALDSCRISNWRSGLEKELRPFGCVEIYRETGEPSEDFLVQIREEGDCRWVFAAPLVLLHAEGTAGHVFIFRFSGSWDGVQLFPMSGKMQRLEVKSREKGRTEFQIPLHVHDSLLLRLEPPVDGKHGGFEMENERLGGFETGNEKLGDLKTENGSGEEGENWETSFAFDPVPVRLSEPNVLVLDMPKYALDGEPLREREEILRIDNRIREKLGLPLRMEAWPQPWTGSKQMQKNHTVELVYQIQAECTVLDVKLALEQREETEIIWNNRPILQKQDGWYVDRRIVTVPLGRLEAGENELILRRPFHVGSNLEAVYLLGDFGVLVAGSHAAVTGPVRSLYFGDWTVQGLPFYGGNVTYLLELDAVRTLQQLKLEKPLLQLEDARPRKVRISRFASPLLRIDCEGRELGAIAFAPYQEELPEDLGKGTVLEITAYGNRANTFGALHNCSLGDKKTAPGYWRTEGDAWSYEYCLHPAGILKAPVVMR